MPRELFYFSMHTHVMVLTRLLLSLEYLADHAKNSVSMP